MPPVKPETAPETRRGLPVKRPKGKPFSYVIERKDEWYGKGGFVVFVQPDGDDFDELIRIECRNRGGRPDHCTVTAGITHWGARQWKRQLDFYENFAAALRWAVSYARRWNARHGLGQEGEGR